MKFEELHNIIKGNTPISEAHLNDLITLSARYPYAASLHTMILIGLYRTQDLRFASELQRRSLYIPDLGLLFLTLQGQEGAHTSPLSQQVEDARNESSFDLISKFLSEHPDDSTSEIESLLSPTATAIDVELKDDYFSWIDSHPTTSAEPEDTMTLISNFLDKGAGAETITAVDIAPSPTPTIPSPPSSPLEEDLLTETLARIYIKQGKYDNALRIIKSLNLNNPKKSSYFAEQIQFLEKLIINS